MIITRIHERPRRNPTPTRNDKQNEEAREQASSLAPAGRRPTREASGGAECLQCRAGSAADNRKKESGMKVRYKSLRTLRPAPHSEELLSDDRPHHTSVLPFRTPTFALPLPVR